MANDYISNEIYKQATILNELKGIKEFEYCTFQNCDFSESDLSKIIFVECEFIECNLSNCSVIDTAFQDVIFSKSKLIGLQFDLCNPFSFGAKFDLCNLSNTTFYRMNLKNCSFCDCQMEGAILSLANLNNVELKDCRLGGAEFSQTNLEGADLRGSVNFKIDPELNKVRGVHISVEEIRGLLTKYDLRIEGI